MLNLLVSPDAKTPFRLSAAAPMQPGRRGRRARLARRRGLPLVHRGRASCAVPARRPADGVCREPGLPQARGRQGRRAADPFPTAIRGHAAEQAKAFGKLATLTADAHGARRTARSPSRCAAAEPWSSASLERTDTITLTPGRQVADPERRVPAPGAQEDADQERRAEVLRDRRLHRAGRGQGQRRRRRRGAVLGQGFLRYAERSPA